MWNTYMAVVYTCVDFHRLQHECFLFRNPGFTCWQGLCLLWQFFCAFMSILLGYCMGNTVRETVCFPLHHFTTILTIYIYFCINKCWVTEELVAFYLSFVRSQIFASDLCFLIKLFMKCGPKYVTAAPFTIYFHPDVSRLNESSIIIVWKATHVLTSKACGGMKL